MILDIITLIVAFMGFYKGFKGGIIETVFSIVSILVAVVAAMKLSPLIIGIFHDVLKLNAALAFILGFVLTFFFVMLSIRFIGSKMVHLLQSIKLNFVNQIAGGFILGPIYATVLGGVFWLANSVGLLPEAEKAKSITLPFIIELPGQFLSIFSSMKPFFKDFWDTLIETMDQIKTKAG